MSIKAARGNLEVMRPIPRFIREHIAGNDMELLHVSGEHLETLIELPSHHRDPFDRPDDCAGEDRVAHADLTRRAVRGVPGRAAVVNGS